MRIKLLCFIAVAMVGLASCKTRDNAALDGESITIDSVDTTTPLAEIIEDEATAPHFKKTDDGSVVIMNERFGFTFALPANYSATDKSNNGDAYYIVTGEKDVDLRIYGENINGNELMAEMELSTCERTETFHFGNGYPGILCYQSGDKYYYYDTPQTRIVFYVHGPKIWQERNAVIINTIAKSIATINIKPLN